MTLKIAIGRMLPDGSEKRDGVREFPSLEAFCAALNKGSAPSTGKQKFGPYWSPFDAPRAKGAKPDWTCLVLDFDHGDPPKTLEPFERIAYQTPSSTPEARRWRVVVALTEPMPYTEVDSLRRAFPSADSAAVKSTQIFWHRHPEHKAEYHPGTPLDWSEAALCRPLEVAKEAATTEPTMSRQALTEALYALDPDMGYDDWLKAGMALHHEYAGAEAGFAEWCAWSERGLKFAGVHDLRSHWQSFKPGGGITGLSLLAMQTGTIDDFPIVGEAKTDKGLRFLQLRDFAEPNPPPYMVKGLIEQGSLIGLIGQRKGGKTYIALDLAFATAQGREWAGAKVVTPGPVLWIAAEGARSLATRRAPQWLAHYGDADIKVYPRAVNMRSKEHVQAIVEAARGARLVIIDSLRRVTPGAKENQSDEFAVALANAEHIALETGATVCIIAHAGKADATSARGTSAIEDSLEIAFAVEKIDGAYKMTLPFARDEDGDESPRYFTLTRIEPKGLVPGVVVEWIAAPMVETPKIKGHVQRKTWKVCQEMNGALRSDVVNRVCELYELRNSNVNRALGDLIEEGFVKVMDGKVIVEQQVSTLNDFETLVGLADNQGELNGSD